jgi:hypothetical protein
MMETVLKIVAALAISAFITRINFGILEISQQWERASAHIALDVRVSCLSIDFAQQSPAQLNRGATEVEDSYN